jgi:hypothetical protein
MPTERPVREIPRWVKIGGIIAILLILAFFVVHIARGG